MAATPASRYAARASASRLHASPRCALLATSATAGRASLLAPVPALLCLGESSRHSPHSRSSFPAGLFAGGRAGDGFDEIVLLAGARPVILSLDDVMLTSSAPPPPLLPFPPPLPPPAAPARGWCSYLSSEHARAGGAALPLCAMDGDHLQGRWLRNCDPAAIRRPERYAYGSPLPRTNGSWDYRLCSRMGYAQRARTREALAWSWVPDQCALRQVDGAEFGAWLAGRRLLFWGDSLSGQAFYSLLFSLGAEVERVADLPPEPAALDAFLDGRTGGPLCSYGGVGDEGGALTAAALRSGGTLVKVLGHAPMVDELRRPLSAPWAWWEPLLRRADIVVANVGHHYRALDGRYARYGAMVRAALARFDARMPPHAHLVFRTSNIGHLGCERAAAPLPSRAAAWSALGGWEWSAPPFQPEYFGQARAGVADVYDWRAPPSHESLWATLAASAAGGGLRGRIALLNVSHLDLRADGHVADAMGLHADASKAAKPPDCLHYCLPGPADAWAHAIYNLLLNNPRYRRRRSRTERPTSGSCSPPRQCNGSGL